MCEVSDTPVDKDSRTSGAECEVSASNECDDGDVESDGIDMKASGSCMPR